MRTGDELIVHQMTINLSASRYCYVISPTNWFTTNLSVVGIFLPHLTFYEHYLSKLVNIIYPNWLIGYTWVPVMDYHIMPKKFNLLFCGRCETHLWNCRKGNPPMQNFWICLFKWFRNPFDYYLQEVRKELKHVSLLRIFQSRNKMQKSTLAYEATIFCSNGIVAILNWATLDIGVYNIQVLANLVWATSLYSGVNIYL